MPIEFVGIIALIVGIAALYRGKGFALWGLIPATLFGSAAAFNVAGVGTIQPAHLLLAFASLVILMDRTAVRGVVSSLRAPNPGFWLVCTWAYGLVGAIFLPRLMAGSVLVNSIGAATGGNFGQVPLGPSSGNINQSVYFTCDVVCFLICSVSASTEAGFRTLTAALLAYCVGDIVLALLDLATYWTGTVYLLDFIRNSTYVIYVDTESTNLKRIIGSFTEASAFAYATIGVFAFSFQLWIEGIVPRLTLPVALASLLLLLFSTSTTAYVALPPCIGVLYTAAAWRLMRGRASTNGMLALVLMPLLAALVVIAIVLYTPAFEVLRDFFNIMVVNKSSSQSGLDRGRVNVEAWQSFLDSRGFGLGIGSVRTSSFVLAVLSNLGVIGGLCYAIFIAIVMMRPVPLPHDGFTRGVRSAARSACLSLLLAAATSGALIDLGLPFFIFGALACAVPERRTSRSSTSPMFEAFRPRHPRDARIVARGIAR